MNIENALRSIAGFFVLLSVALAHYVSPWFLLFTAFVGLNLLQSGFTGWCPMMSILERLGMSHAGTSLSPGTQGGSQA